MCCVTGKIASRQHGSGGIVYALTFMCKFRSRNTRATAAIERTTSRALVCQLHTDTRMHRFPRQVVLLNNASPLATTMLVTASVHAS